MAREEPLLSSTLPPCTLLQSRRGLSGASSSASLTPPSTSLPPEDVVGLWIGWWSYGVDSSSFDPVGGVGREVSCRASAVIEAAAGVAIGDRSSLPPGVAVPEHWMGHVVESSGGGGGGGTEGGGGGRGGPPPPRGGAAGEVLLKVVRVGQRNPPLPPPLPQAELDLVKGRGPPLVPVWLTPSLVAPPPPRLLPPL